MNMMWFLITREIIQLAKAPIDNTFTVFTNVTFIYCKINLSDKKYTKGLLLYIKELLTL